MWFIKDESNYFWEYLYIYSNFKHVNYLRVRLFSWIEVLVVRYLHRIIPIMTCPSLFSHACGKC